MSSIDLGSIVIKYPIILAPMSNVTDFPFRKIATKMGAEFTVSEMLASKAVIMNVDKIISRSCSDSENTIIQIVGADSLSMSECAKKVEANGARVIDINFGCPCKKINGTLAGAALMKDELLAHKIIKSVVDSVNVPVTLKMRMGWDANNLNAPRIAKIAEDSGIKMITVHCRTRAQMYNGKADWKFIKQVKSCVKLPIIVNGDIKNEEDIVCALNESGADGVMIGRGSYGKPWIIGKLIKKFFFNENGTCILSGMNLVEIISEHYELILEHYGAQVGMMSAKKHLMWYSAGMIDSTKFRSAIVSCTNHHDIINLIKCFFSSAESLNC